jgi:hypothetical protein
LAYGVRLPVVVCLGGSRCRRARASRSDRYHSHRGNRQAPPEAPPTAYSLINRIGHSHVLYRHHRRFRDGRRSPETVELSGPSGLNSVRWGSTSTMGSRRACRGNGVTFVSVRLLPNPQPAQLGLKSGSVGHLGHTRRVCGTVPCDMLFSDSSLMVASFAACKHRPSPGCQEIVTAWDGARWWRRDHAALPAIESTE